MKQKKLNSSQQYHYDAYKKEKTAFSNWMATNIKNGIRIVDENECKNAWNAAITYAIRTVNKSNMFDVIDNLQKLKNRNE
jgi:hypothetical protein